MPVALPGSRRAGRPERRRDDRDRALLRLRTTVDAGLGSYDDIGLDDDVADLVALARRCGAPLARVVRIAAAGAEQARRIEGELLAAVAPARTVARSLVAMPLVAVPALALVTGVDLVGFYLHDPVGRWVGLLIGVLLGSAALWMRAILAGARTSPDAGVGGRPRRRWVLAVVPVAWWLAGPVPALLVAILALRVLRRAPAEPSPHLALAADLVAVAVSSGHDLPAAIRLAGDQLERGSRGGPVDRPRRRLALGLRALALDLSLRPRRAGDHEPALPPAARSSRPGVPTVLADPLLALARTGTPGVEVLHDLADRLRADRATRARTAAARLPAHLTFPTALVLVPATVLAIGVPIVLQGLARLAGT